MSQSFPKPDKPSGRGLHQTPSIVKQHALNAGLTVLQPNSLQSPAFYKAISSYKPDIAIVVAYGKILPPNILSLPKHGCLNVHASLLPKLRGAAPIQWALYHGDSVTGVTLMKMNKKLDAGPILASKTTPITESENAKELSERLSHLGAEILEENLFLYLEKKSSIKEQIESEATLAPALTKIQGYISWNRHAKDVYNHIRAVYPWPGAQTTVVDKGKKHVIRILHAKYVPDQLLISSKKLSPGMIICNTKKLYVACKSAMVSIEQLQEAGRKPLCAKDFLAGKQLSTDAYCK